MARTKVSRRLQDLLKGGVIAAFLLMALGLSTVAAYAQFSCTAAAGIAIWNISGSGDWNVQGNWNPSTEVPDSSSTSVCILNATPTTVTLNTFQLANMNNLTINAADTVSVSGFGAGLNVYGTSIQNAGNIVLTAASDVSNALTLGNDGSVTLSGGGTVTLTSPTGGSADINSEAHTTPTLTNVDNTIVGNGFIGPGQEGEFALVNGTNGTIDATTASGQIATLTLDAPQGATNQGLMEATTGTLEISSTTVVNAVLTSSGLQQGNITANGGTVQLANATIQGGTLNVLNGGTMETPAASGAALDGSTAAGAVTINGTYTANGNTDINGTIINQGNLQVNGGGEFYTILGLGSPSATVENVTLEGGGTVTLYSTATGIDDSAVIEQVGNGPATLTNVDNTIQGNGIIGGNITVTNDSGGTIDATTATGQLSTLSLTATGINNAGLMEATNGAEMLIETPVTNTGGNITANAGDVVVDNTITGGTLNTLNGGTMGTLPGANNGATLIGVTISTGSTYATSGETSTNLQGTITNNGTMVVSDGGTLSIGSGTAPDVTLQGGGTVTLTTSTGGVQSSIAGAFQVSGATLTNVDNTIQGNGLISGLALVNDSGGTIEATTASGQITTLTLSGGSITNNGTFEATAGTTLHATGGATFINFSGSTLAGGTYDGNGTIQIDAFGSTGGEIVTNNATVILDGSNSGTAAILDAAGENALSKLATNEGSFTVENGGNADFTTAGNLTNSGTVTVGAGTTLTSGTGGASNYTQSSGLTTVDGTLTSSTVTINGGLLIGAGTVAGAVTIGSGGTIQAGDAPGTLNISGSLAINGALNEAIDSASSFDVLNITGTPGSLTLGSGSTLDILLASGYDPAAGTSFTIADFSSLSGTFGSIANDTFDSGAEEWKVGYNSGDIVLTAENVTTPPTTVDANWTTGTPASWTTASNWACSPGASTCVPSNGTPTNTVYDVNIDNTAAGATMTLSSSETVDTLALTAGTLDIASGGSLNLANRPNGITDIPQGAGLSVEGSFTAGSNSALAGLTSVEGSLTLDNGQTTGVTPSGGTLTVSSTGSVNVSAASTVLAVTGNVSNSGSVKVGNGASLLATETYTQTAGSTDVNGTLMAPTVNINGGTLSGNGTLQSNVTIGSGGTLLPGETGTPGTLAVNGNLSFTGGTLDETINSDADNGYSVLNVSGTLNLTGGADLDIILPASFTFSPSDTFLFATAGTLDGQFTITDPTFDNGQYEWVASTTGDAVDIYLTIQPTTPTPAAEPGSLLLLAMAVLGLAVSIRRTGMRAAR